MLQPGNTDNEYIQIDTTAAGEHAERVERKIRIMEKEVTIYFIENKSLRINALTAQIAVSLIRRLPRAVSNIDVQVGSMERLHRWLSGGPRTWLI